MPEHKDSYVTYQYAETEPPPNPKEAQAKSKLLFSAVPMLPLYNVALVMTTGACKYGLLNFRTQGDIKSSMYFDSTMRHLLEWWEGSDLDGDSYLHPLDHAIAGLLVLRDAMGSGRWADDRPPLGRLSQDAVRRHMTECNSLSNEIMDTLGGVKEAPGEWEPSE